MYHSQAKGTILLLITALIWGAAFVAQSVGMDYIGPFTFSAARDVIAIIVLIPVILLFTDKGTDGTYPPILQQLKPDRITLIGGAWCGLVLGAADTLQQVGISMTTAGKAGFITALYIILVPLMGHFMGHKVPRIIVICVTLAIAGFYLLCINGDFQVSFGDFLVLCCAVLFALHILVIDHFLLKRANSIKLSWVQYAIAFLFSGTLTVLFEHPDWSALWDAKWPLLYAGGLSSGVGVEGQHQARCPPLEGSNVLVGQGGAAGGHRPLDSHRGEPDHIGVALTDHELVGPHRLVLGPVQAVQHL